MKNFLVEINFRLFKSLSVVTTMVPTLLGQLRKSLQIKKIITSVPCVLSFAVQPKHVVNNSKKDWLLRHFQHIKKTAEVAQKKLQ